MSRATGEICRTMTTWHVTRMCEAIAQIYSEREGIKITATVTKKPEYQDEELNKEGCTY